MITKKPTVLKALSISDSLLVNQTGTLYSITKRLLILPMQSRSNTFYEQSVVNKIYSKCVVRHNTNCDKIFIFY